MNGSSNKPILIEFKSEDGQSFFIESEDNLDNNDGFEPVTGANRKLGIIAGVSIDQVFLGLHPIVSGITSTVEGMSLKPSEVQVELSLKINSDLKLIIAKVEGEAQLKISLKWKLS